jgi:lipid II:glycine glycyltransferase (peptidoglycan interpeptide bridge formation enzyme)
MFRYKKIGFIKILDIWFEEELFYTAQSSIKCLHENKVLDKKKYDFALVGKTFILDISREPSEIFNGFSYKSCKYAINKATRDGIHVWKAEKDDEKIEYMRFQNSFSREKKIAEISSDELAGVDVFCAETQDKTFLGGCAFVLSDDNMTVRYKHGATSHMLNANEAILWEAIKFYHSRGVAYFDFGGVVITDDKSSYYYRHYKFKEKFGGELADSYTYFRMKGKWKIAYFFFKLLLMCFWRGDVNNFVNWLNRYGMLK